MQDVPDKILSRWGLTVIAAVSETGHARVWNVKTAAGDTAALKVYRRANRGNEAPGIRLLQAWEDRGAVVIIAETPTAVLMNWLDGPSLGDIACGGETDDAVTHLADMARQLHQSPPPDVPGLASLQSVLAPFFNCRFATTCPVGLKTDMQRGMELARHLLDSQHVHVPLHGDLHYDNVLLVGGGLRVIDAKGYVGDPAFEMANALRNPKELPELVRNRRHIDKCLDLFSEAMSVSRSRLAKWSAAKCALSIFLRSGRVVTEDAEADLLNLLLRAADQ